MSAYLLIPVLLPVLTGALLPLFSFQNRRARECYVLAVTILNSLIIAGLLFLLPEVRDFTIFRISEAMPIQLHMDGMSKVFLGLIAFLWPLASVYALEYMKHEGGENAFFSYYLMTYGVTAGIALSENLVTLYFFYEFLTLVTLPIVMHGMKKKNIAAGRKYVLYSMGGAAFAFMGMIMVYAYAGTTDFAFGGVLAGIEGEKAQVLRVMYLFAAFGFGVKAAIFPFHGWLPTASVAPTPVTALLHAVAVVNAGAFAILRITYYSFGTSLLYGTWVQYVLMAASLVTILYGSSMALKEQHFKRRLAYSTVSNLSYMIFGAALMTPEGMVGALAHFVFHGIIKITLFFVAGAVLYQTGKNYVNDLFGYGRRMPVMFGCFTVASVALVGVPPTVGFVSKWNLLTAAAGSSQPLAYAGIAVLLISSVLTAMYLLSVVIKAYFPGPGFTAAAAEEVRDPNGYMKVPVVILSTVTVVFGMFSAPFLAFLEKIAAGLK